MEELEITLRGTEAKLYLDYLVNKQKHTTTVTINNSCKGEIPKVYQFTVNGRLVNSFKSLSEACKEQGINMSTLSKALTHSRVSKGYRWGRSDKLTTLQTTKSSRGVIQLFLDGSHVETWVSAKEASNKLLISTTSITVACNNKQTCIPSNKSCGYLWVWEEDYVK